MKLRLPKRRGLRVVIYLLSLLLVLLAVDLVCVQVGRRIAIGHDTTRIAGPTMEDGPIDYLKAIESHFSKGVTQENNAAPLLLGALGRNALARNQPPDGITAALGMPPLPEKGDYLVPRKEFLEDPNESEESDENVIEPLMLRPWKASDRPRTAAWLKANEKPLATVADAAKRSRFFYPYNAGYRPPTLVEILLPYVQPLRDASRALTIRAMLRVNDGDFDGAREDLLTLHRLAGLLSQAPTLIDRLVAFAIDSNASRAEQNIIAEAKLDARQVNQWKKSLDALEPLNGIKDAIDVSERFMFLDSMQFGARGGMPKLMGLLQPVGTTDHPVLWHLAPLQFNTAMKTGNDWYDHVVDVVSIEDRAKRQAKTMALMQGFKAFAANQNGVSRFTSSDWPIAVLMPAIEQVNARENATFTERQLARVALALAAHKLEHGNFPASLSELGKSLKPADAQDPFNGKPLTYRQTRDGCLLYSVGADLMDDGGSRLHETFKGDLSVRSGETPATSPTTKP